MILVISNIADEIAPDWINTFPAGVISLITASDFHNSFKAGISVNDFYSSSLNINGRRIKPAEITGIITLVAGFLPMEFYYIDLEDREYVCTEVNSFISYFLNELPCRKMNPPTRRSLTGLGLQKIEWINIAQYLNIPVKPFRMKNGNYISPKKKKELNIISCTMINSRIIENNIDEQLKKYMQLLSNELKLPYLNCFFSIENSKKFQLIEINGIPDISKPENREAIIKYFT